MKAPSEKHLEDWLCEAYKVLKSSYKGHPDDWYVIGRQVRLPSGIADLVVHSIDSSIVVVELKKGVIDAAALAQCLRYMRDLRQIMGFSLAYARNPLVEEMRVVDPVIEGQLVGYRVESDNLLVAAAESNVTVWTYDYDPETEFYTTTPHEPKPVAWELYAEYAQDGIGEAFRKAYMQRALKCAKDPESLQMAMAFEYAYHLWRLEACQDQLPKPEYDEFNFGLGMRQIYEDLGGTYDE